MRLTARYGCFCTDRPRKHNHFFIDGKEVSEKKYRAASPRKLIGAGGALMECTRPACWPMQQDVSMEVLAHQKKDFEDYSVKVGVPTEFAPSKGGVAPVFRDKKHLNDYLRATGKLNRSGGIMDYTGQYSQRKKEE